MAYARHGGEFPNSKTAALHEKATVPIHESIVNLFK